MKLSRITLHSFAWALALLCGPAPSHAQAPPFNAGSIQTLGGACPQWGAIPYQGQSGITQCLAPGAAGQSLVTGGPNSNPNWSTGGLAGVPTTNTEATQAGLAHTFSPQIYRLGYSAPGDGGQAFYAAQAAPCSLNSGAGDGGSQVPTSDGGCWILQASPSGVDIRVFGAANSVADNMPILAAAVSALSPRVPVIIEGAIFPVRTGLNSALAGVRILGGPGSQGQYIKTCLAGLRADVANLQLIKLTGPDSTVDGLCAYSSVSNTSGFAVDFYGARNKIQNNTFYDFCSGVVMDGNTGTAANIGSLIFNNLVTVPNAANCPGYLEGPNTATGNIGQQTILANQAYCNNANGVAFLVKQSAGDYVALNHFGFKCAVGTKIYPGLNQSILAATYLGSNMGDSDVTTDLEIDTADATATIFSIKISGSWASTAGVQAVLVHNTANSPNISGIYFNDQKTHVGAGVDGIVFDATGGPLDSISVQNSMLCATGAANAGTGIKLLGNILHPMITGNKIEGCDNFAVAPFNVGILNNSTGAGGDITSNHFGSTITPVTWGATQSNWVVAANWGLSNGSQNITANATITLGMVDNYTISSFTANVTAIAGPAWGFRNVQIYNNQATSVSYAVGATICNAATQAQGATITATFRAGLGCWALK